MYNYRQWWPNTFIFSGKGTFSWLCKWSRELNIYCTSIKKKAPQNVENIETLNLKSNCMHPTPLEQFVNQCREGLFGHPAEMHSSTALTADTGTGSSVRTNPSLLLRVKNRSAAWPHVRPCIQDLLVPNCPKKKTSGGLLTKCPSEHRYLSAGGSEWVAAGNIAINRTGTSESLESGRIDSEECVALMPENIRGCDWVTAILQRRLKAINKFGFSVHIFIYLLKKTLTGRAHHFLKSFSHAVRRITSIVLELWSDWTLLPATHLSPKIDSQHIRNKVYNKFCSHLQNWHQETNKWINNDIKRCTVQVSPLEGRVNSQIPVPCSGSIFFLVLFFFPPSGKMCHCLYNLWLQWDVRDIASQNEIHRMSRLGFSSISTQVEMSWQSKKEAVEIWRAVAVAYFLVLGHRHGCVVVVVLEAAVGAALQQQAHRVHLTSAAGVVQWRVAAVWLAVDIAAVLQPRKQKLPHMWFKSKTSN